MEIPACAAISLEQIGTIECMYVYVVCSYVMYVVCNSFAMKIA